MRAPPKMMLLELPTADEIDDLACTSPEFNVRKFEYDRRNRRADLDHIPCKGQIVLVVRGVKGTLLVRTKKDKLWGLPSDLMLTTETAAQSVKRIAGDSWGVGVRSTQLMAMYDVIWHHSDYTVKRLHLVYECLTDDEECAPGIREAGKECVFVADTGKIDFKDEIFENALSDCSEK